MSMSNPVRIGHYKFGKTLGVGSFGKVKLAEHVVTRHKVAIKILNWNKIRALNMEEKVRREIKFLKLLEHPHIIRLYEVIETPSDIFVVMEYVSEGELFDHIVSRGRLPVEEARKFFQQIISGVEYIHWHKIAHRDLKPENLLLDEHFNVKIADFGLSNLMRDGQFLSTSCGSPNYAAPEVISGSLYAGPEVDVWSCGVILYALLCGSLPFDDESIPNLFRKIKNALYTLPSHLSEYTRHLIPQMLVVDPMRRITVAQIRQHPWFQQQLPAYLVPLPSRRPNAGEFSAPLDDTVVQELVGMNFFQGHPDAVRAYTLMALQTQELNEIRVAYELIVDHKLARVREDERRQAETERAARGARTPTLMSPALSFSNSPRAGGNKFGFAGLAATSSGIAMEHKYSGSSSGSGSGRRSRGGGIPMRKPSAPRSYGAATAGSYSGAALAGTNPTAMLGFGGQDTPSALVLPTTVAEAAAAGLKGAITGTPVGAWSGSAPAASPGKNGRRVRRRRWYLGIQSKKDPAHVMGEVFRALRALHFHWKVLSPYSIRARWQPPLASMDGGDGDGSSSALDVGEYDSSDSALDSSLSDSLDSALSGLSGGTSANAYFARYSSREQGALITGGSTLHMPPPSGSSVGSHRSRSSSGYNSSGGTQNHQQPQQQRRRGSQQHSHGDESKQNRGRTAARASPIATPSPSPSPVSASDIPVLQQQRAVELSRGVQLGLQLYKVQPTIYLLDFHAIAGHPFAFMSMCGVIISELSAPARSRAAAAAAAKQAEQAAGGGRGHPR